MASKNNRYSIYLRPLAYLIDLSIIFLFALQWQLGSADYVYYIGYATVGWFFLSLNSDFYEIYRFTNGVRIVSLTFLQLILFGLIVFSFFGIFPELVKPFNVVMIYLGEIFGAILLAKLGVFYLLRRYRKYLGGNYRNVVIIGKNNRTRELFDFFQNNPIYGYKHKKTFDIKRNYKSEEALNKALNECFDYIIQEGVDEIYCSSTVLPNKQIKRLSNFADNNLKVLKFVPDDHDIYTKHLKVDYYDYLPVVSFRNVPINEPINKLIKRTFDVVLSLLVIVLILSWLTPILAVIIKLSSKGPVFFQQLRNGLDNEEFYCYKFRSMVPPSDKEEAEERSNGDRVMPIGKFMRKTSIDELPQFFNVLRGNMSTVGPRPHMVSETYDFADQVDKFMVRHFVKPGITGLAQVSGYRGEIETENDIKNRVKYDIFYVENWSLLLDIKIIVQTFYKVIKGDKKAY